MPELTRKSEVGICLLNAKLCLFRDVTTQNITNQLLPTITIIEEQFPNIFWDSNNKNNNKKTEQIPTVMVVKVNEIEQNLFNR